MHRQQYYVKTEQPANGAFLSLMARCAALYFGRKTPRSQAAANYAVPPTVISSILSVG